MMRLSEISALLNCSFAKEVSLTGISIDSRCVVLGNLFIAIRGEHFDAQDFIPDVVAKGAAAIVCHQAIPNITIPQLVVPDTLDALTCIAIAHRQQFTGDVIALTGSNGKTTVKEMIATILPQPSYATPGNLNNHIGVPLSVLQLTASHRMAVFELGASHMGEIAHTVAIVKPKVALINNIAPAHIEGFLSIEGVAAAKGEIYQGLAADGIAIINNDDTYAHFWDELLTNNSVLRFSSMRSADIFAREIHYDKDGCGQFILVTPAGEIGIKLRVPGAHNVSNALAAAACTFAVGLALVDIASGLQAFGGVAGRMTFHHGKNNAVIIDDTYNANLNSVLRAVDVLASRAGRRIFVFGDMGELGSFSQQHHEAVGLALKAQGIDGLMTCGIQSKNTARAYGVGAQHFDHQIDLVQALLNQLDENTTVLVKGSRASAMEKIVQQLVG